MTELPTGIVLTSGQRSQANEQDGGTRRQVGQVNTPAGVRKTCKTKEIGNEFRKNKTTQALKISFESRGWQHRPGEKRRDVKPEDNTRDKIKKKNEAKLV